MMIVARADRDAGDVFLGCCRGRGVGDAGGRTDAQPQQRDQDREPVGSRSDT